MTPLIPPQGLGDAMQVLQRLPLAEHGVGVRYMERPMLSKRSQAIIKRRTNK